MIRHRFVFACILVPAVAVGIAATPSHAEDYPLRSETAETGSNIKKELARGYVPFDKRYDELTAEQKAKVRARYTSLRESEEPPYPATGMGPVARLIGQIPTTGPGLTTIFVKIDESGEPQSARVTQTPDPKFARSAAIVLMSTKFKAASCDNLPCSMEFIHEIIYR